MKRSLALGKGPGSIAAGGGRGLAPVGSWPHLQVMNLDLTDEETAAPLGELDRIIDGRDLCR
jgi:hypothetical protein